jgi:hypothetical protein
MRRLVWIQVVIAAMVALAFTLGCEKAQKAEAQLASRPELSPSAAAKTPAPPVETNRAIPPSATLPNCKDALKLPTKPTCQFVNSLGQTKVWTHEDAVNVDEDFNKLPKKTRNAVLKAEKETAKQEEAQAAQRAAYPNATLVGFTERETLGVAKLQHTLVDPDSLRFDEVFVAYDGTICYDYRAKNGFGGYGIGHAVLISKTDGLSKDASTFNKHCAGKFGWDDSKSMKAVYNK